MSKQTLTKILCVVLLSASASLSAKNIQYVSDELTIPMRTGVTTSHKILKFLTSGMAVEIIEQTEDNNYAHIKLLEDESKTGWVEMRLLMASPSAREQLVTIKKRNESLKGTKGELKGQLIDLQTQNDDLQKVQGQLENKISRLESTLSRLKASAAEPIRIAEENEKLKQELSAKQSRNEELLSENAFLADDSIKKWFALGAAVSLGSLILGLLITRISWKKKGSWAGSF